MALRKHRQGELTIEQTRDLAQVRGMIVEAGMMTDGIEWPAACYLLAYDGDQAIGVVGIEAKLDAALIRSLYVKASMRGRGIGAALVSAARKAAHTRGARHLYLLTRDAHDYFARLGFESVDISAVMSAMTGAPQIEHYRAHPEECARDAGFHLDISGDGVIER